MVFLSSADFLVGVTFPGVEPFLMLVMVVTDQNDSISSDMSESRQATQRGVIFIGLG